MHLRMTPTRIALAAAAAVAAAALALPLALRALMRRANGQVFSSDGVPIHYSVSGEGTPVILLHGFGVNAGINWRLPGISADLAIQYQVIAMDLRGHGASGRPDSYGLEMVEDVVRLMDHLGIERAHVVGYSLGGVITLKLASEHPERLLSASVLGAGWENPQNSMFLGAIDEIAEELEAGRGVGPLAEHLGGDRERTTATHRLFTRFVTSYLNEGPALAGVVRGIPELTVEEGAVSEIDLPVLTVAGTKDPMRNGSEALQGRVKDLRFLLIDDADHVSATSHPELRSTLIEFLEEIDTRQPLPAAT